MQKAYKLQGKHRHYDWGGTQFIPQLMGIENTLKQTDNIYNVEKLNLEKAKSYF